MAGTSRHITGHLLTIFPANLLTIRHDRRV